MTLPLPPSDQLAKLRDIIDERIEKFGSLGRSGPVDTREMFYGARTALVGLRHDMDRLAKEGQS